MQQAQEKKSQQHDPFSNQFYEDLQSAKIKRNTSTQSRKPNRNTKKDDEDYSSFFKKMGIIGLAAVLGIGIYSAVRYDGVLPSTYDDDYVAIEDLNDPEDEGYLHVAQMNLYDTDGDAVWSSAAINSYATQDFQYGSSSEVFYTAGGLTTGSTWDDFIEAFGEYYFYEISFSGAINGDVENHSYDDDITLMTVEDFHTQYVESGLIDIENTDIDVEFKAFIIDNDVIYDSSEYYSQVYGDEDRHGNITYTLEFVHDGYNKYEGLSRVTVSTYVYDN